MPQENVEVVRRAFDAFSRGDMDAVLANIDPEVVIVQPRELGGVTQHGHAGVREAFARRPEQWDEYEAAISSIVDAGDQVVVETRTTGRSRETGLHLAADFWFVITLASGKITPWLLFVNEAEALEAAGLSE